MASSIKFDNGASYHSDTYVGTDSTTDGVKVIERDGGSPYDYIHYYDAKIDSERAFNMGVFVYEYVENLVDGLAIDQLPIWILTPNTFPEQSRGRFAFADYAADWDFNGQVIIDSLTVSAVPEPPVILLFGIGLIGLGIGRRKVQGKELWIK